MTDYHELFQAEIENRLRAGGHPESMVALVKVYQDEDETLRRYAFDEWLRDQWFTCEKCKERYKRNTGEVREWDDLLCARCDHE